MRALVVAKAPVPGRVKTRLGREVGMHAAADLAAAALLDTIAACREAFGPPGCLLALSGDLAAATRGAQIDHALHGWKVLHQRGSTFAQRLAHAHADVPPIGPVLQVGMDTPQVTASHLHDAGRALEHGDAVLGPAYDGGWWVLGLHDGGGAAVLRDVPMSEPTTYDDTLRALVSAGHVVRATTALRDVDTASDAAAVARACPDGEFARTWEGLTG